MYNIIHVMENVKNIVLVGIVVLTVMFSKNRQSRSSQLVALGVGIDFGTRLESGRWGIVTGLTGEYGQLIIEYGIMATILSVLVVVIMDRKKEKKGIERVGLIFLATLGMIILIDAEDLLTVYLAIEAQSLAIYTLTILLLGVLAVTITLFMEFSILFYICTLASMIVGTIAVLNQSYIKRLFAYSAIAYVDYVLLVLTVRSYTSIFSFSLAGIPLLSGFFGKWLVFSSAIHSQFYLLAIFGVLSSIISAFYYLRLIKLMYFQDSPFFHSTVLIKFMYFQDSPYYIYLVSSIFSIYTLFLYLYSLLLAVSTFVTVFFIP